MARTRRGDVWRLGLVEYEDGQLLMDRMVAARKAGSAPDGLFLLHHPHTITLGRRANEENILLGPHAAHRQGVSIIPTGRGGDVTYHGPGQIVGYPIVDLKPDRRDAHRYVRDLEEVMIRALADYGVQAGRKEGLTGVWVGDEKIAAIGVRLSRWITSHGFALNINTDLGAFEWIIPCGITDKGVTSLAKVLGRAVNEGDVETRLIHHFGEVFDIELSPRTDIRQSVQVVPVRRRPTGWEALAIKRVDALGGFWQPITGRIENGESPMAAAAREIMEETQLKGDVQDLGYVHRLMIDPDIAPGLPIPTIFSEHAFWVETSDQVQLDPKTHDAHAWLGLKEAAQRMQWTGNRKAVNLVAQRLGVTTGSRR